MVGYNEYLYIVLIDKKNFIYLFSLKVCIWKMGRSNENLRGWRMEGNDIYFW